jgi:hypothetical protein
MERSLSCDSCVRTFCGIGRFITEFTGVRHLFLSRARWIKSAPLLCASFKTRFNADCTRTCSTQCCVILRCRADGPLSAVVSSALKTLCISFPYRFKASKWFLSSGFVTKRIRIFRTNTCQLYLSYHLHLITQKTFGEEYKNRPLSLCSTTPTSHPPPPVTSH